MNIRPVLGRFLMPQRPLANVDADVSKRTTSIELMRSQLFAVDVDRKKRIDDAIDYFGATPSTQAAPRPSVQSI
jgi:hypothetical protein